MNDQKIKKSKSKFKQTFNQVANQKAKKETRVKTLFPLSLGNFNSDAVFDFV